MRGALQVGIEQIEVRDIPEPVRDEGMATVKVRAAGICGSDLHPYRLRSKVMSVAEGHEVGGEITSLPASYSGPLKVGDLVAVDTLCWGVACGNCEICRGGNPKHCAIRLATPNWGGGFAQALKIRPTGLFRLPPYFTAEQGALVEPFTIGVHAMRYGRVKPGSSVVVVGAGTIGLMALMAARAMDAGPVHILARYPHQKALAQQLGATSVIDSEGSDVVAHVRDVTGGGADVVIETVGGHVDTVNLSFDLARRQGLAIILGIFPHQVPVNVLRANDRELWAVFPDCYGTMDGIADFDYAINLIAAGKAPVERLVTHRMPLEMAPTAFRTAMEKSTGSVKVHLVM